MYHRMIKWILIASLAALLAACGSAATTSTPAASDAVAAGATAAPAASAASQTDAPVPATAAPTSTAAAQDTATQASGDVRTFTIVPEQTEASYTVQEQFLNRDLPTTAVGTTNAIEGQFQFAADGQPTGQVTKITVDLRTLTSDSAMRDKRIRSQWLESDTYPFATFVSTGVAGVPASYIEGQEVSFQLTGNLTIHGVTQPATFDVTGTLAGHTVTGTATTKIQMTDFGFEAPSVAGILTVEDNVTVTVNFSAVEAA
jgi:polyisoprenoid-binding protein YceI